MQAGRYLHFAHIYDMLSIHAEAESCEGGPYLALAYSSREGEEFLGRHRAPGQAKKNPRL